MKNKKENIIIVGGGFAGIQLARKLNGKGKNILLIDRVNHHMFQPLFYQLASGRIEPSNISFPFRKIFQHAKDVQFRMTEVEKIIPEKNQIMTNDASFSYDKLIIATGCKTNFFGNSTLEESCFGMKSTHEAINIRNNILITFEKLIINKEHSEEGNWNIVIVGSGPTGVELAGAFAEMKTYILPRDYPKMDFSKLRIILISPTSKPLANMSQEAQDKSEVYLKKMGVEFMSGEKVTNYDGKTIFLDSGKTISSTHVIWAAGVTGNIIEGVNPDVMIRNRYIVDRYNKVKGYDNIFAIGDIAYMETPKYPHGHPQLANVAINQGKNLAKNLCRPSKEDWKKYEYFDKGSMATIGKHRAVVDLPYIKFQGFFAWFFWMFLHLMLILSVRNKMAIFFNWMWSYLNGDSSLRLITSSYKKELKS